MSNYAHRRRNRYGRAPAIVRWRPSSQVGSTNGQANGGGTPPKPLSKHDRQVLRSLDDRPRRPVSIAESTGIPRTKVEAILKKLSGRNMAIKVRAGWRRERDL